MKQKPKYDVAGYYELIPVRFMPETVKLIKKIIRKDPETYGSVNHFIRASAMFRVRQEKQRLKL